MTDSVIREVWKEIGGLFLFYEKNEHNKIEFYLAGMNISDINLKKTGEIQMKKKNL